MNEAPGLVPGAFSFAAAQVEGVDAATSLAIASSAPALLGNPAAIHAASAAANAAPSAGPFSTPRLMKSAALSGNTGALQRCGNVASVCQASSCAEPCERAQPSSA